MSGKKPTDPSPESIARAKRQRIAQEEGVRAMADAERNAVAVRKNMGRLRELREAREAAEAEARLTAPPPEKAIKKRKAPTTK